MADELHVGEVAGGQRVELAAAVEAEALKRPRADLRRSRRGGDRPRGWPRSQRPGGDLAGDLDQRDRALRREVAARRAPPGPASAIARPRRGRRAAARATPGSAHRTCPSGATIRRWITCGPRRLDQLLGHRPGERLPGWRGAPRAQPGHPADQRPEQRVALEASVELGEVVVDAERVAAAVERRLELARGRRERPRAARASSHAGGTGIAAIATSPVARPPRRGSGPGGRRRGGSARRRRRGSGRRRRASGAARQPVGGARHDLDRPAPRRGRGAARSP